MQAKSTKVDGLYYLETSFDQFMFITKREIQTADSTRKLGTMFIVSNPKRFSSEALFPELFRQPGADPDQSPIYTSAVYTHKKLGLRFNKYPFPISLNDDDLPKTEVTRRNSSCER